MKRGPKKLGPFSFAEGVGFPPPQTPADTNLKTIGGRSGDPHP